MSHIYALDTPQHKQQFIDLLIAALHAQPHVSPTQQHLAETRNKGLNARLEHDAVPSNTAIQLDQHGLQRLLQAITAHGDQVIWFAADILSRGQTLLRQQLIQDYNVVDSIIYLPIQSAHDRSARESIWILQQHRRHHNLLIIDVFRNAGDQAPVQHINATEYHSILSIYRQVRQPIQAEMEMSSSVCYATELVSFQNGVLFDGMAYLATVAEIVKHDFDLDLERY